MSHPREVRPTRRQAALALTTLAALTLSACGAAEEAEFEDDPSDPAPQDSAAPQPAASDGGGEETEGDAPAGDAPASEVIHPDDAVATISYTLPTDEVDGTMSVGLHHLRQRGQTMELLLTFTPEFSESGAFSLWDLHGKNHTSVAPALFDRENLKRYDTLRVGDAWDSKTVWNSEHTEHKLASGDTQAYWANFATPEDAIDTINIAIPGAPEFEDVPIEQGTPADAADGAAEGQE